MLQPTNGESTGLNDLYSLYNSIFPEENKDATKKTDLASKKALNPEILGNNPEIKKIKIINRDDIVEVVEESINETVKDIWGKTNTWKRGIHRFPNGIIEEGRFHPKKHHLASGRRQLENEETIFVEPVILYDKKNLNIYFSEVLKGYDKTEILILSKIKSENNRDTYCLHQGSPLAALLKLGQNEYGHGLLEILKHENNNINTKEFFALLLTPNKSLNGELPISLLSTAALEDMLFFAQEENIPVDLTIAPPSTKKILLDRALFSGDHKVMLGTTLAGGTKELLSILLLLDPSIVCELDLACSPFTTMLVNDQTDAGEKIKLLLDAVKPFNMEFSAKDQWMLKAAGLGTFSFSDQEFKSLDPAFQEDLFRVANIHCHEALILRLGWLLNIDRSQKMMIKGPAILAANMDGIQTKHRIEEFLTSLRACDLLLTHSEFMESRRWLGYINKQARLDRVIGKHYLQYYINKLDLKQIKVPEKVLVIQDDIFKENISIDIGLGTFSGNPEFSSTDLTVYSKKIRAVNRKMTPEEDKEFWSLVHASGFSDIHGNYVIAEDGVYIIDTEMKSFDFILRSKKAKSGSLPNFKTDLKKFGFLDRKNPIIFPMKSILKPRRE
ncbi:MAG: hypothetical protein V4487_08705 [Chlamydiota bacterium]